MKDLLTKLVDGVREDLGQPVTLLRLLEAQPEIRVELRVPPQSIAAESIVRWHELGKPDLMAWPRRDYGELRGWRDARGSYSSFTLTRPEYAQLGQRDEIDVELDISDILGLAASKSKLTAFQSLDQMVETNSREMIDDISMAKLAANLDHREIRIIHSESDHFARYLWDGRVFLMNSGGSHHFAAARYIAARLNQRVPLHGRMYVYSLNGSAIASLCRDYEMFVINDEAKVSNSFHDAMRSFGATWLWHPMPRPYEHTRAILLPREDSRSMRVAAALREGGIVDLGAYLTELATNQVSR